MKTKDEKCERGSLRCRLRVALLLAMVAEGITGCSVYNSLDPQSVNKKGEVVDQTIKQEGQPYYLPKAIIHLTIQPVAEAKEKPADEAKPAAGSSTTVTLNVNGVSMPTPTPVPTATPAAGADGTTAEKEQEGAPLVLPPEIDHPGPGTVPETHQDKPTPLKKEEKKETEEPAQIAVVKYAIKVELEIEPDRTKGPYFAQYRPNWFYSDDVNLTVNTKQLLTSVKADISDRTAEVIYNLAQTAANVGIAFGAGKEPTGKPSPIAYKRIDIDVRFDPFNKAEVEKVQELLAGEYYPSYKNPEKIYVSPFELKIESGASVLADKAPAGRNGLLFPEPTALTVTVRGREEELREVIKEQLALVGKKGSGILVEGANVGSLRALLQAERQALAGTATHREERFSFVVPNPYRSYLYDVGRSSFVQNKTYTLAITDGMLAGVAIKKPSEAEGFSMIPLNISQKILDLPKSLLSYKIELVKREGELAGEEANTFNKQQALKTAKEGPTKP